MTIDATRQNEKALLRQVQEARQTGAVVSAVLKTDDRVFARITDGIYREPASALRELIANAYDADATEVRVDTDAPRFSRITVRDNGHGLSEAALTHVICHIGGSLKRSTEGASYNVVSKDDSSLSPGGRKLIGKLGIGLFSVSQLTHHLIIVTKVKGEDVRRVCDIVLMPQSDAPKEKGDETGFVTGTAQINTIPADDVDSQGTEITLVDIRNFVRESLQSRSRWTAVEPEVGTMPEFEEGAPEDGDVLPINEDPSGDEGFYESPPVPSFHIGRVSVLDPERLLIPPVLPWTIEDDSTTRFEKLVAGIHGLTTKTISRIKLEDVLDNYLRTLWTLALSVPLNYVKKHPFSLTRTDGIRMFALSNQGKRPKALEIDLPEGQEIRQVVGLTTEGDNDGDPFSVFVDGISLSRPLSFPPISEGDSEHAPLLFVGRIRSEMATLPAGFSGGALEFEAYFRWEHTVTPVEHNGIMVRINGASGILFDYQFLKYQTAELTRLRQLTAEVYVIQGLDAALNIDRESFNISHPHYQFLKKWVHHSLRQVMSRHKNLSSTVSSYRLETSLSTAHAKITEIVGSEIDKLDKNKVSFSDGEQSNLMSSGIAFDRNKIFESRASMKPVSRVDKIKETLFERQILALAQLLEEYDLLGGMNPDAREKLLKRIVDVFSVSIKK